MKHLRAHKSSTMTFCGLQVHRQDAAFRVTRFPTEVSCVRCLGTAVAVYEKEAHDAKLKLEDLAKREKGGAS